MVFLSKTELRLIDALAAGKSLKKLGEDAGISADELGGMVDALKAKLGAHTQAEIPDRFVAVTGWSNPAKDYPA